jgi:chemotaxis family two-component system response regulator Rcp1
MNRTGQTDPARILVIEDNPADVLLLREACNSEGLEYEFTTLVDGEEARAFLRREGKYHAVLPPNLILLDMNVPKADSVEILEEIRRRGDMAEIPVAILSSADAPSPKDRDAVSKATCYLTKPPSLDEFLSLGKQIRSLLEHGVPLP